MPNLDINRVKHVPKTISNKKVLRDGGLVQCRRCGFYYGINSDKMNVIGGKYLCYRCLDPEDR